VSIRAEERIASLIATAGIVWTAQIATSQFTGYSNIFMRQGPLEICAVGILVWLHAKWRRSIALK
jgi:hypothetical protein